MLDANEKISGISEGQLSAFLAVNRKNDEKQRVIVFSLGQHLRYRSNSDG
jgi:hypothetical protein